MSSTAESSNTRPQKDTPYDKCDYIPCLTNTVRNESERVRLKKCTMCKLVRYCSKECQKSDWPSHKVWCKTHQAGDDGETEDWRDLYRRIPVWRKTHTQALRDALVSSLNLPSNPNAHRDAGIRVYLVYHPERSPAKCMQVERIARMRYAGQEGQQRQQLSASRLHYEKQYKLQNPVLCYGAGLAVLSIKHKGDPDGLKLYVIPLEISTLEARETPCFFWMELLAKTLHTGAPIDPETDYRVRDELLRVHASNAARTEQNWHWDADDEEVSYATSVMPNFTLKDILTNDALDRAFITTFASSEQRAIIDLAKSFGERLENGTRRDHEAMGVFGLRDALEAVKRRLPDTWEVVGVQDALYWRLATLLRRSSPTRIAEAEPYLRRGVEIKVQMGVQGLDADPSLLLYWAASLANVPGKEDEALQVFDRGVRASHSPSMTDLWARANISRMLRRTGKLARAKKEEQIAATWISRMIFTVHPAKLRKCVFDDRDPYGTNHILEDPRVAPLLTAMDAPLNSPYNWTLQLGNSPNVHVVGTVPGW